MFFNVLCATTVLFVVHFLLGYFRMPGVDTAKIWVTCGCKSCTYKLIIMAFIGQMFNAVIIWSVLRILRDMQAG